MATVRLARYEVEERLLPPVCMKCGAPATSPQRKSFSWYPPWVNILILAGVLPFVIVAAVLTKRIIIHAPFCDEHRHHWTWRSWFVWLGLMFVMFMWFGAFAVAMTIANHQGVVADQLVGLACVGTILIGLVWL